MPFFSSMVVMVPVVTLRKRFDCRGHRMLIQLGFEARVPAEPAARNSQAGHVPQPRPQGCGVRSPEVTAMGVLDNEIEQGRAAEVLGHGEGRRLVDPHQRRMDDEAPVHAEAQRDLHGLDGVVAAIGIAGVVGLAHAGDDVAGAAAIGERAGEAEEDQIAAGHEGGRQPVVGDFDRGFAGERGVGNIRRAHRVQPCGRRQAAPSSLTAFPSAPRVGAGAPQLDRVALAVVEADGFDPRKALERPGEADGGILPAGEEDERFPGLMVMTHHYNNSDAGVVMKEPRRK